VADAYNQLLDYVATHPNAGLRYHACDMILAVHTDASYLSKAGGKSRAARHLYLTNQNNEDFNDGAILTLSAIIKHVMSSASEAELSALYHGCKMAAPLCTTLKELGHNQANPPNYHQQHHRARPHHGYYDSQSLKIHGSTFSLAEMQ
jgi:hypothetical protein